MSLAFEDMKRPRRPTPRPPHALGLPMLSRWRRFRGLSQEDLAAAIDVTQGMISQWERGKSDIPLSKVHHIATALDTTVGRLFLDPFEGADIFDALDRLPENERPRAIRILRDLAN